MSVNYTCRQADLVIYSPGNGIRYPTAVRTTVSNVTESSMVCVDVYETSHNVCDNVFIIFHNIFVFTGCLRFAILFPPPIWVVKDSSPVGVYFLSCFSYFYLLSTTVTVALVKPSAAYNNFRACSERFCFAGGLVLSPSVISFRSDFFGIRRKRFLLYMCRSRTFRLLIFMFS